MCIIIKIGDTVRSHPDDIEMVKNKKGDQQDESESQDVQMHSGTSSK